MNAPIRFTRRRALSLVGTGAIAATVAACANENPLDADGSDSSVAPGDSGTLVIGSQAYYSNEIIAELFAQVLEAEGVSVDRQFQIGQREVYMAELESGAVDLIPEYTGNLLQFYDPNAVSASPEDIYAALQDALPEGLRALEYAQATDQDSYTVTAEFAQANGVMSLADLASYSGELKVAANSELETRPFGPKGLRDVYGVEVSVLPVEDSGGPLTVRALTDGTAQLANIYTASPAIEENNLVILEDPQSLILPQNVVPLASTKVGPAHQEALARVTQALTLEELTALNARSVNEQARSADLAKQWLAEHGIVA